MWNQVRYDPRSYECNLCNCVLIFEVENELDKENQQVMLGGQKADNTVRICWDNTSTINEFEWWNDIWNKSSGKLWSSQLWMQFMQLHM